jgi:hypothetical protein
MSHILIELSFEALAKYPLGNIASEFICWLWADKVKRFVPARFILAFVAKFN